MRIRFPGFVIETTDDDSIRMIGMDPHSQELSFVEVPLDFIDAFTGVLQKAKVELLDPDRPETDSQEEPR